VCASVPEVTLVSSLEGRSDDEAPVLVLGNPIGTSRDVWSRQVPVFLACMSTDTATSVLQSDGDIPCGLTTVCGG
jgi:hypothetical protein